MIKNRDCADTFLWECTGYFLKTDLDEGPLAFDENVQFKISNIFLTFLLQYGEKVPQLQWLTHWLTQFMMLFFQQLQYAPKTLIRIDGVLVSRYWTSSKGIVQLLSKQLITERSYKIFVVEKILKKAFIHIMYATVCNLTFPKCKAICQTQVLFIVLFLPIFFYRNI